MPEKYILSSMIRETRPWQDSLATATLFEGDQAAAVTWLGYAKSQLRFMLQNSLGPLSATFAPIAGVRIRIDTRPNRIFISAVVANEIVYIGPVAFQIPDDPAYDFGTHDAWDVVLSSSVNNFLSVLFTDPSSSYAVGTRGSNQFTRSTVDKAVKLSTFSGGVYSLEFSDAYGGRGLADMPVNNVWVGVNGLIVNASMRAFKDATAHSAVLPPGDSRYDNFVPHHKYRGVASGTSNPPPLALGVYIGNIFYTFPSALTQAATGAVTNTASTDGPYIAACRPEATKILSAVSTAPQDVGRSGNNAGYGRKTTTGIRVGLSHLSAPTVTEDVLMSTGAVVSHSLCGTLIVESGALIDEVQGIGGRAAIIWMEFSPDTNFLYVAMFWTATTDHSTTAPIDSIKLVIRRWLVYDGGLNVGTPITLATIDLLSSSATLANPFPADRITAGFRCQMASATSHRVGFTMSHLDFISGADFTSDLTAKTLTVKGDITDPGTLDLVADSFTIVPTTTFSDPGGTGVQIGYHTIAYADYLADIVLFAPYLPVLGSTVTDVASAVLYANGVNTAITPVLGSSLGSSTLHRSPIAVPDVIGLPMLSSNTNWDTSLKLAMMEVMRGNTYASVKDVVFVRCAAFDGTAETYVPYILRINAVSGAYELVKQPVGIISNYIVPGP